MAARYRRIRPPARGHGASRCWTRLRGRRFVQRRDGRCRRRGRKSERSAAEHAHGRANAPLVATPTRAIAITCSCKAAPASVLAGSGVCPLRLERCRRARHALAGARGPLGRHGRAQAHAGICARRKPAGASAGLHTYLAGGRAPRSGRCRDASRSARRPLLAQSCDARACAALAEVAQRWPRLAGPPRDGLPRRPSSRTGAHARAPAAGSS